MPAEVLRGMTSARGVRWVSWDAEADFISPPPCPRATVKSVVKVCKSGTDGREDEGRRGRCEGAGAGGSGGGGREEGGAC